jgi:hypothetical protein
MGSYGILEQSAVENIRTIKYNFNSGSILKNQVTGFVSLHTVQSQLNHATDIIILSSQAPGPDLRGSGLGAGLPQGLKKKTK